MLIGATNRVDTLDEAIVGRRLEPIEVGLPDAIGRLKLLQLLCRDMKLAKTVNLRELTPDTEGMSGADLKRLRDTAGMKALSRASTGGAAAKARLAGGYCLRTPAQGACPYANICEHCPNFRTDIGYLPVLAAQRADTETLARDAEARGWISEADRHRRLIERLDEHIRQAEAG